MSQVKIYTTQYCPYCDAAKNLLTQRNIEFEAIDVSNTEDKMALVARTGWRTVPQIFIGEELIGGYQELAALDQSGELTEKLKATSDDA